MPFPDARFGGFPFIGELHNSLEEGRRGQKRRPSFPSQLYEISNMNCDYYCRKAIAWEKSTAIGNMVLNLEPHLVLPHRMNTGSQLKAKFTLQGWKEGPAAEAWTHLIQTTSHHIIPQTYAEFLSPPASAECNCFSTGSQPLSPFLLLF